MSEVTIASNIFIEDMDKVVSSIGYIKNIPSDTIDANEIIEYIQRNPDKTIYYLDSKLKKLNDVDECRAKYVWLDSGKNVNGDCIYIALIAYSGYYSGYYTGTAQSLAKRVSCYRHTSYSEILKNALYVDNLQQKYAMNNRCADRMSVPIDIPEHIVGPMETSESDGLLVSEDNKEINNTVTIDAVIRDAVSPDVNDDTVMRSPQETTTTRSITATTSELAKLIHSIMLVDVWGSVSGLARYLIIIGGRMEALVAANKTEYYIKNEKQDIIINTGLLNKYMACVHILCEKKNGRYLPVKMIGSKHDIIAAGFSKEDSKKKIKIVSFLDADDYLSTDMADYDVSLYNLSHIIDERSSRFPAEIAKITPALLANEILSALTLGLKILEVDEHYAKPIYNAKSKEVSCLLPFYIEKKNNG